MKMLVPVCLVFLFAVMESSALKCYHCHPDDPRCINLGDDNDLVKEDEEYNECFKADIKIGKMSYVARGGKQVLIPFPPACNTVTFGDVEKYIISMGGADSEVFHRLSSLVDNGMVSEDAPITICSCTTDLCNDNAMQQETLPAKVKRVVVTSSIAVAIAAGVTANWISSWWG